MVGGAQKYVCPGILESNCILTFIVMLTCGSWSNPDLPNTVSEILEWMKSFRAKLPHPEWAVEFVEKLIDLVDGDAVTMEDTGRIRRSAIL